MASKYESDTSQIYFNDPISTREAAEILEVSPTRIQQLKKEGILQVDKAKKLSREQVCSLNQERSDQEVVKDNTALIDDAIVRRKIAEANIAETKDKLYILDLQERQKIIVKVEDVINDAVQTAGEFQQYLDAMPSRLCEILANKTAKEVFNILTKEFDVLKQCINSSQFISDFANDSKDTEVKRSSKKTTSAKTTKTKSAPAKTKTAKPKSPKSKTKQAPA